MKNLKTSFNIHCNNHLHYRLLISYNLSDSEKNTNIMTIEKREKKRLLEIIRNLSFQQCKKLMSYNRYG